MKFTDYLRLNTPSYDSEEWIIGGERRERLALKRDYAGALRMYDPERFKKLKEEFYEEEQKIKEQENLIKQQKRDEKNNLPKNGRRYEAHFLSNMDMKNDKYITILNGKHTMVNFRKNDKEVTINVQTQRTFSLQELKDWSQIALHFDFFWNNHVEGH